MFFTVLGLWLVALLALLVYSTMELRRSLIEESGHGLMHHLKLAYSGAKEVHEEQVDSRLGVITFFIVLPIAAIIGFILVSAILQSIKESDSESCGNPPPEVPPITESDLMMPLEYPFKIDYRQHWPVFTGHPFPLGGPKS